MAREWLDALYFRGIPLSNDAPTNGQVYTYNSYTMEREPATPGWGGWAVDSVNWQTGVVVLDADDIDDATTTNKFVTAWDITKLGNLSWTNTWDVTVSDSSEIDLSLTGQQISASIVAGSIDESKLDASVNASLDLADSALQANQTITLSWDVSGSWSTSISTTIWSWAVDIAMLSASWTPSGTTFLRGDNTWSVPAGAWNVSKVGTPVNNQVWVWTWDGTIEWDANLTFDTSTDTLTTVNTVLSTVKSAGSWWVEIKNSSGTDTIITGAWGGTGTSIVGTTNIASASADYHQVAWGTGTITDTATGSSTNININLVPKGTGRLQASWVNVPTISSTDTLTNKRVTRRLTTTNAPWATPTTNTDNVDIMKFTGLATAITSMTTNLSGTPVEGDKLEFIFVDNGTARAITRGASFAATTVPLPTTTVISTKLRVGFEWGGSTRDCIAVA